MIEFGLWEAVSIATPADGYFGWKGIARAIEASRLRRRKRVAQRVFSVLHAEPWISAGTVSMRCMNMSNEETDAALVRLVNMNAVTTELKWAKNYPHEKITAYSLTADAGALFDAL